VDLSAGVSAAWNPRLHAIIMALRRNLQRGELGARISVNMTFIMSATLIALAGHLMEIALWASALDICGAVADISAAIYSSAGSYFTPGSMARMTSFFEDPGPDLSASYWGRHVGAALIESSP
jgi:hypothetical protein